MAISVLVWTCVAVFVAIAILTVLSLIGIVNMQETYRNKLFYVLIVEIVTAGVLVFKQEVSKPASINFVRVVSPNFPVTMSKGSYLYIYGTCIKDKEIGIRQKIFIANTEYDIQNIQIDTKRNILTSSLQMNNVVSNAQLIIKTELIKERKQIFIDSLINTITVN